MSWRARLAGKPSSGELAGKPSSGEHAPQPNDLRGALALYQAQPFKLYKRLTGPPREWWEYCRGTACGTVDQLGEGELSRVFEVIDREEPPQSPGAVTGAARAVHAVSRALAIDGNGDTVQRDLLSEAAGRWRNGPAAPRPQAAPPFSVDGAVAQVPLRLQDRTRSVLTLLANVQHDRGEAIAAICALMLAGDAPKAKSAVQVSVVLVVRDQKQVTGVTGRLDVQVLPGGPPGLYPDPRAVTIQPANGAFNNALRLAWQSAEGVSQSSCVLWRVTPDADVPGHGIDGSSLGAAFAVSLQQLLQHRPASRLSSLATLAGFLTRLRPSCVITGELSEQRPAGYSPQILHRGLWLASVGQMDAKLKAVGAGRLRLVAPAANKPSSPAEIPADVPVYWASTLRLADRYARRVRPVRTAVTGLAVLTVIGGSAGPALALHYESAAGQQHQAAVSAQLTSAANRLRSTDPAVAAQLDVAAYDARASASGYTSMLGDEEAPLDTVVSAQASALALSPDGTLLATVLLSGPVSLRDTADPAGSGVPLEGTGAHSGAGAEPVGFSPDGQLLAAAAPDGGISLWDVADSARPVESSPAFGSSVTAVAFSPNGGLIATGTQQGTVQLWDVADPAHPAALGQSAPASGASGGVVTALMFSSNGQSLYSGTQAGTLDVWDTAASGSLTLASQPVPGGVGQQDQVSFSDQGQAVVTDASGDTFLYNVTGQGSPQTLTGGPAAISPDGLTIAARDQAGDITLLNTTQPLDYPLGAQLPIGSPTGEGAQSPGPMSFDAAGTVLAAGENFTVVVWHLPAGYQADPDLPLSPLPEPDSIDGNTAAVAVENNVFVQQLSGNEPVTYRVDGTTSGLEEAIPALGAGGHLLAVGELNGRVSLWSLNSGRADLVDQSLLTGATGLSISANGTILAATAAATAATPSSVSLWNLADPAHPARYASPFGFGSLVALSPDGKTLAVASGSKIQLWNLSDPAHPAAGSGFSVGTGNSPVIALAVSPGGKMLAAATKAGTVRLWNLGSAPAAYGQPIVSNYDSDYNYLQTRVDSTGVNALAFSTDSKTLTSINADNTIRNWDLQTSTVTANICGATAAALTAAVWNQYLPGQPYAPPCSDDVTAPAQQQATPAPKSSPADGSVASLCTSGELALSSRATASTSSGVTQYILVLLLTNKSRNACSLTGVPSVSLEGPPDPPLGGTYQIVSNALPGQPALTVAPGAQAHVNLTYLPASQDDEPSGGGSTLWVPATVKITLPGTDATLATAWAPQVPVVRQDTSSTKGTFTGAFLAGDGLTTSPSSAGSPKVNTCAPADGSGAPAPTQVGSMTTGAAENDFVDVAFSPDCEVVAAGGNGIVQIRNMVTGTSIATLSAAPGSAVDIDAFTPDGKALAVAGGNGYTTLWNAATGALEARFPSDPSGGTYCLAISPDSSEIFTGGSTGVVGIWGVTTRQSAGTIKTGTAVGAMALSPDGKLLAVAGYDGIIRIYDTASRAQVASLPANDGHVWSMAFSPDGTSLAAGANDLQWWNVATHKLIAQRTSPGASVTDVAFSPDGKVLAAGGYKMAGLWNTSTYQLITTLKLGVTAAAASASASYPNGMAFSRSGAILAIGWYGTLEFWKVAEAR